MKKSLLEGLIQILTEAPMSDEDRADSDVLRNIFYKRSNRSNAKITKDEQAVLDKYGITLRGKDVIGSDGRSLYYGRYGTDDEAGDLARMGNWRTRGKANLADVARKRPERRYAQKVNGNRWPSDKGAGYGQDTDKDYREYPFDAKERDLNTKNSKYQQDLSDTKDAIKSRNRYNRWVNDTYDDEERANSAYRNSIDQAENEYRNAEQIYKDRLKKANGVRDAELARAKEKRQAYKADADDETSFINSIKDKYRKNKNESLNESYAHVTYFDYKGNFKEKTIQGDTPKSVINKIKKINDSFGVYNIEIASKDIAYSPELKALGLDVNKVDLLTSGWN